jgi:hypothetical protein
VKPRDIARWRMRNLGLWGGRAEPAAVVARLGAIQAQEFPYAKWSVAQRTDSAREVEIDGVFDEGKILRTHVLRPTWHFVVPEDIRWLLALTAPRVKSMMASYDRRLELDDRLYARTNRLISKALQGGAQLTRKELVATLNRAKITGTGQRFGHILLRAELEGLICSGAPRGKQQTYALLDDRVPPGKVLERDEALGELTRRYFTTRGPATLKDFSWWASLRMPDCRRGVEIVGKELEHREVGDRTYWFASSLAPPGRATGSVDLVQGYDEVVVSYTVSRDALTDAVERDIPREIMFFWHPILFDGRLAGHWRHRRQGNNQWIELFHHHKPTRNQARSLEDALQRYEDFLGRSLEVGIGKQGTPRGVR